MRWSSVRLRSAACTADHEGRRASLGSLAGIAERLLQDAVGEARKLNGSLMFLVNRGARELASLAIAAPCHPPPPSARGCTLDPL